MATPLGDDVLSRPGKPLEPESASNPRHVSGTRVLMVIVAGAALVMGGVDVEGPWFPAAGVIPLACAVVGWWRSRRKVLGSVGWAIAGGVVQALLFGGFFVISSLVRKPTGPYQDTSWAVAVLLFSVVASVLLAVVIGLLVATGFRLAGVRAGTRGSG